MAAFLSDAWFAELEANAGKASPPGELEFTFEQIVEGDPTESWQVQIRDGRVRIVRNPDSEADVRLRTDRATATGIHAGEISAQRAFLDGRLQLGGEVQALMDHREALAELGLELA